jgi:hypothetical protein
MDDDRDQYWTHSTGLAKNSSKPAPPTTTSPALKGLDRSNWIRKCAQAILSSYRRDDFADADGYAVQLAMVLERYDDALIRAVTSPVTGIQRTCKFPPSIAEMVEFIEEQIRRTGYASNWDRHAAKQLAERKQLEELEKAEPLEHRRAAAARILAEYHSQLTPEAAKPQRQSWRKFSDDDLRAMYPKRERA